MRLKPRQRKTWRALAHVQDSFYALLRSSQDDYAHAMAMRPEVSYANMLDHLWGCRELDQAGELERQWNSGEYLCKLFNEGHKWFCEGGWFRVSPKQEYTSWRYKREQERKQPREETQHAAK